MADVAASLLTPGLRPGSARPSRRRLRRYASFWRNWVYLGIGELSLTWPVAAILRCL